MKSQYVNHKIVSNYYMISICQNKTETRDNKPRQNENKIKPLKGFIFSPLIECAVVKIIVFQCALNLNSYSTIPAGIYLLKVNNRNARTRCEICSKLTIKIPDTIRVYDQ